MVLYFFKKIEINVLIKFQLSWQREFQDFIELVDPAKTSITFFLVEHNNAMFTMKNEHGYPDQSGKKIEKN